MFSRATLIHCIFHTLCVAFLLVSLGFNYAFIHGEIYIDYSEFKKAHTIEELYPEEEKHGK